MAPKPYIPHQRFWTKLLDRRLVNLAQPGRLFLLLALPFGIIFIYLSAPFQAPDEHHHFYRAYSISTGHLTGLQVTMPQSVYDFSQTVSKDLPGNDQNKQSKRSLLNEFFRPFEEQPEIEVSIINSAIVSPFPYLPQSLGIFIGRLLHLIPILIFYQGRIANFLVWLGLTFLAIHVTPVHKRLFAALAIMPMTLHQAASNSPDAATIAISFLFFAFFLRLLLNQRNKIRWLDWAIIGVLTIAMALCKSIYVLSTGLLLLIPIRRFHSQRAALPLALSVIGLGLATGLIWLQYSSNIVSVEMMNTFRTPTTDGLFFILKNPLTAAPILWRSVLTYTGLELRSFVGILGWMDTVLPIWVYPLYYALLLFTVILEPLSSVYLFIRERLYTGILAVGASLVIMSIFFYPEVTVGNGVIDLVQGRYSIPFGMLYLLPLSQRKWSLSQDSPAWVVVGLLHLLVLVVSVRAMLWRYYAI